MAKRIGRNTNVNDTAVQTLVTLNDSISTVIVSANPDRIYLSIGMACDAPANCIFVKLQAAAIDNIKIGELLFRSSTANINAFIMRWQMTPDNIYTGEVSGITLSGNIDICITEY